MRLNFVLGPSDQRGQAPVQLVELGLLGRLDGERAPHALLVDELAGLEAA